MNNKNLDDFAIETSAMQSDGSSDGFSLVDDGDSLVGSEVYVESEVASSTATPATVATFAGGEPIIVPQETDAVWWGKTFVLVTWVLVTIVESVVVYFSTRPGLNVVAVVVFAVVLLMVFFTFDHRVDLRHKAVINEALRTRKIVSSLFPPVVQDRLFQSNNPSEVLDVAQSPEYRRAIANIAPFEDVAEKGNGTMTEDPQTNGGNNDIETPIIQRAETMGTSTRSLQPPTQRLRNFLTDDLPAQSEHSDKATNKDEPIADLFPEATVMFADISGFTAWSSVREPSQVFKLLETIYRSFDRIAKKRSVFKVETIGDCYVGEISKLV